MLNILLDGNPFSVVERYDQLGHLAQTAQVDRYRLSVAPESLPTLKKMKLEAINRKADEVLEGVISRYPKVELLTWFLQCGEAIAYKANPEMASTPLLSIMSARRNITMEQMIGKVETKTGYFTQLAGSVLGQRQAHKDELDRAETEAAIVAVDINVELPEL